MDQNSTNTTYEYLGSSVSSSGNTSGPTTNANDSYAYHDDHYKYYDYEGDWYIYEYYDEHLYEIFDFEHTIYGFIWPILVFITTCCNLLVVGGFLRKRMRNPTNMILVSIAITDSLTGLVTLPATFHVFSQRNYVLTEQWCEVAMISRLYISRAFHTISVWQTLLLGIHRYLQLRHPVLAQRFCSMRNTGISIGCMCGAAFILHVYHAFDNKVDNGMCHWVIDADCGWTCVYIWCTLLLSHLLPCFGLVFLTYGMISAMKNMREQETLSAQSNRRKGKLRNLTIVVILIVVIFLVPELPYGIFYLVSVSLRHDKKDLLPFQTNRMIHCIYELLLVVSFHLNFWVYCALVRTFRSCVKTVLSHVTCQNMSFSRFGGDDTSSSDKHMELQAVRQDFGEIPREDTEIFMPSEA